MNKEQVNRILADYAQMYPPMLSVEQAAQIAQVPKGTLYDWSHRQMLDEIKVRRGRRILLARDDFVRWLLSDDDRL